MPDGPIVKDSSESARAALRGVVARREDPLGVDLRDQLDASAFWQQCEREDQAEQAERARLAAIQSRADQAEHIATELLEVAAGAAAGALSTWKNSRGMPVGGTLNTLAGMASKAVSVANPESRALRVAARSGKVLLHSQISMITRFLIEGDQ